MQFFLQNAQNEIFKILKMFKYNMKFTRAACWINPLNANITKWSNTLKKLVGNLPTNCLSVFDHFAGLALKGLNQK